MSEGPNGCCGSQGGASAAGSGHPLCGKRIVVTRAPEQAEELTHRLIDLGAQVISLPMVRFAGLEDKAEMDRAILGLDEIDWLIFTSANAVRFFVGRCHELGRRSSLERPQIAVVGRATRAILEAQELRAAFMPCEFGGSALAAELAPRVAGKRVLLPRSDRAGEELPDALRKAGALVTEVVAYRTAEPVSINEAALDSMRHCGADAILFFSPSAFTNFVRLAGADTMKAICGKLRFAAVGPMTAAAIRAAGVNVAIEAATATSEGLTAALAEHFSRDQTDMGRIG